MTAARPPGLILAHGTSRRFAGVDKGLTLLGGTSLAARAIAGLQRQCGALALNAPPGFAVLAASAGAALLGDAPFAGCGPLAGIRAGLAWARAAAPGAGHLLVAPVDMPFLPADLATRLAAGLAPGEAAIARAPGQRIMPVLGLWPLDALEAVEAALRAADLAVKAVLSRLPVREVVFPAAALFDIDDPAALAAAERRLTREHCESATGR